jgi:hypothetical protein
VILFLGVFFFFFFSGFRLSTQPIRLILQVKNRALHIRRLCLDTLILEHPAVHAGIGALNGERGLRHQGLEHKVVVAVGAVLVGVLEVAAVLAEALAALFAGERHLERLEQGVGGLFGVAFGAVVPFFAWWLASQFEGFLLFYF